MPINYRRYPKDWKTRIIPAIWKRADHCCEECKVPAYSTVYSVKVKSHKNGKTVYRQIWFLINPKVIDRDVKKVTVILTVAHLDHDAQNHLVKLDRLKLLCQRCHLVLDSQVRAQRRSCGHYCLFPLCTKHFPLHGCVR